MENHAFSHGRTVCSKAFITDPFLSFFYWAGGRLIDAFRGARVRREFNKAAQVDPSCRLGLSAALVNFGSPNQVSIGARSVIRGILRVGDFGPASLSLSENVYVGDGVIISCTNKVKIGANVLLAHGVQIFDNNSHPVSKEAREKDWHIVLGLERGARTGISSAPIEIENGAWIGFNAIILKGVRVGEGAIVAAGSVVRESVPPFSICAGNPAKVIGDLRGEK